MTLIGESAAGRARPRLASSLMNRRPLLIVCVALVILAGALGSLLLVGGSGDGAPPVAPPAESQSSPAKVRVVTASEGPSLVGTLRGRKVEGATLELYRLRAGKPVKPAVAVAQIGTSGSFRFLSLRPGAYRLVASTGPSARVRLPARGEVRINLV